VATGRFSFSRIGRVSVNRIFWKPFWKPETAVFGGFLPALAVLERRFREEKSAQRPARLSRTPAVEPPSTDCLVSPSQI